MQAASDFFDRFVEHTFFYPAGSDRKHADSFLTTYNNVIMWLEKRNEVKAYDVSIYDIGR